MTKSVALSPKKARKVVREALRAELEGRGYDNYAAEPSIWEETLDEATWQVLNALNYREIAEIAWQYEDMANS